MVLRSYSNNCDDSRVYMQVCFYKIKTNRLRNGYTKMNLDSIGPMNYLGSPYIVYDNCNGFDSAQRVSRNVHKSDD